MYKNKKFDKLKDYDGIYSDFRLHLQELDEKLPVGTCKIERVKALDYVFHRFYSDTYDKFEEEFFPRIPPGESDSKNLELEAYSVCIELYWVVFFIFTDPKPKGFGSKSRNNNSLTLDNPESNEDQLLKHVLKIVDELSNIVVEKDELDFRNNFDLKKDNVYKKLLVERDVEKKILNEEILVHEERKKESLERLNNLEREISRLKKMNTATSKNKRISSFNQIQGLPDNVGIEMLKMIKAAHNTKSLLGLYLQEHSKIDINNRLARLLSTFSYEEIFKQIDIICNDFGKLRIYPGKGENRKTSRKDTLKNYVYRLK